MEISLRPKQRKETKKRAKRKGSLMETLTIRYGIPRWYITLGVPAAIALLLVVGTMATGIVSLAESGTSFTATKVSDAELKKQQYEAILQAQGNNTSDISNSTAKQPPTLQEQVKSAAKSYFNFDDMVVAALLIGLTPYAADITKSYISLKKRERDFVKFLFELSELVRGGIDPIRSLILLAERDTGSITKNVRIAAKQTQLGYSFEQAMRNLEKMVGSKLVGNYTDLVVQASYSGGSVSDLIRKASEDMDTFLTLEAEKLAGLKQYQMILYTSQVILIGICIVMLQQFWPSLQNLSFAGGTGGVGFLAKADIGDVTVERDMFYLLVINGFLGGLVIGKISEGSIKHGIKHGLIIVIIAFGAFTFMITPPGPEDTKIRVVSYMDTGYPGLPVLKPLIVNVTDSHGVAKPSALVKFSIDGTGGNVIPNQLNADRDGIAQVKVQLGTKPGPYIVTVTAGKTSIAVPFTAKEIAGAGAAG